MCSSSLTCSRSLTVNELRQKIFVFDLVTPIIPDNVFLCPRHNKETLTSSRHAEVWMVSEEMVPPGGHTVLYYITQPHSITDKLLVMSLEPVRSSGCFTKIMTFSN